MSWVSRTGAAVWRAVMWLVPAGRRDWAEAVWAEASEIPAGWPRLAWRAGGIRLIMRETRMTRRVATLALFALAAAAAAWSAWPDAPVSHGAAAQGDVIVTLLLLAGLPMLARRLLGPPANRSARWLRAGFYAAIVAIMAAKAVSERFAGAVPSGGHDLHTFDAFQGHSVPGSITGGPNWAGEIGILLITACYLAVILGLTARHTPVAPATLAVSSAAGLALGLVMYAVAPLGLGPYPTDPWLHGLAAYLVVGLAWVLLFCGPFAAGVLSARRCYVPDDASAPGPARAWQGVAAGLVCSGVGALCVTVLGSSTTALMIKSAWVRGLLYHGLQLTPTALYGRELYASQDVGFYAAACIFFPLIGVLMGAAGAGLASVNGFVRPDGPGRPRLPGHQVELGG
jgi:hypothetical protein